MKTMNCRVGTVHKCLTSAADICRRGNRVVLDDDGSFIINKRTGETTPLHQVNGTYIMRVKILRPRAGTGAPGPIAALGASQTAATPMEVSNSPTSPPSSGLTRPAMP